jgi:hypothetical protein
MTVALLFHPLSSVAVPMVLESSPHTVMRHWQKDPVPSPSGQTVPAFPPVHTDGQQADIVVLLVY